MALGVEADVAGNHGGEVRVQSQEGRGSTFVLRIPLARTAEPAPDPTEEQLR